MYIYHEQFNQNSGLRILKIFVKSIVMNSVDKYLGKDNEQYNKVILIPFLNVLKVFFNITYSPVQASYQIMF